MVTRTQWLMTPTDFHTVPYYHDHVKPLAPRSLINFKYTNSLVAPENFRYGKKCVQEKPVTCGQKYPNNMEKFVHRVDTVEHKVDKSNGEKYFRRIAYCSNVIPNVLRIFEILDEKAILLEEEAWLNQQKRTLLIKSRNVTWAKYANMWEHSVFKPSDDNPHWTRFEQHGVIDIKGLGSFGRIIEMFADKFLHAGAKRALNIMDTLLHERSQTEFTVS